MNEVKQREVRHFHDTEMRCSAFIVDWADLNRINSECDRFLEYLGNYMDDDSTTVWALFGDFPVRYCVKIE